MTQSVCEEEIGYELIPMAFNLLIKPLTEECARDDNSGIIMPENVKAEQSRSFSVAKVLSIGPSSFDHEETALRRCQVGDYIIYNKIRRESLYVVDYRDPSKKYQLFFINDDEIRSIVSKEYAFYQAKHI